MKVIDIVKSKLKTNCPGDEELFAYIEEVAQSIKNFCNRNDIPAELKFVHANMVVDLINVIQKGNSPDDNRAVTAIKEGDVQVSFGSVNKTTSEISTENILFNYKKQLYDFRKMRR